MYFIVRSIDECVSCVHLRIVSRISDVSMQIRWHFDQRESLPNIGKVLI